jgi:hypothetical protein
MSVISWWRRRRMTDPVRGTLRVTVCPSPDHYPQSAYYSAIMLGVVQAPGVAAQAVEITCSVPSKRCPESGQRIPVIVDRARPDRVVVLWKEVPVRRPLDRARAHTHAAAASMRRRHLP